MARRDIVTVREITAQDVELIANYWLHSDPDFLTGMGVDREKIPSRAALTAMLLRQIELPYREKPSLALIAEIDGSPSGHCNVNGIVFGQEATMHLHLWNAHTRKRGLGTAMVLASLPIFFDRLKLHTLWCEPYAENPAPNKLLQNIGFEFVKRYVTIPGSLNFEQEVHRYVLTKERFEKIKNA